MTDVCTLILEQHHELRRQFAALDEYLAQPPQDRHDLARAWQALHRLLDAHAEAEEILFYPLLLELGLHGEEETKDAISDHNDIRGNGAAADGCETGDASWWSAVLRVRDHNSAHMAEEERGALADLRVTATAQARAEAGERWEAFMTTRLGELADASHDKDPERYIAAHDRTRS